MPWSRALVLLALFAAGCGMLSGLDSLHTDGGSTSDAQADDHDVVVIDQATQDVPVIPRDGGTALSSPSACSYIEGTSPLPLTNTAFTIELWLQVKAQIQGDQEIDPILWNGGRTTSEPGWTLALTAQGLMFCVADASAAKCSSAFQPPVGDLVHVGVISSVTQSARNAQLFLRDVSKNDVTHLLRGQLVNGVVDWTTTSTFTVGGAKASALCSNAPSFVIDDLRVYDGAASPAQLDSDMGDVACNTNGLLAYFKFDEGAGATTAMDCAAKLALKIGPFATFVPSPFP